MSFPQVSTLEFVILGHLFDGRTPAKRIQALLRSEYNWHGKGFFTAIKRLADHGLIEIHRYAPTNGEQIRQESWYEITVAGRQIWSDAHGFFRRVVAKWNTRAESVPISTLPELKRLRPSRNRTEVRVATDEEACSIHREAAIEFALIYATARELDVLLLDLMSVEIADYLPLQKELRIRLTTKQTDSGAVEENIGVSASAASWIRQACGRRTRGPIFLSPQGKPWEEVNLRMHFSRVRRKLQLPKSVMMQDARTKRGERLDTFRPPSDESLSQS